MVSRHWVDTDSIAMPSTSNLYVPPAIVNDEKELEEMPQGTYFTYHPVLDGTPCDAEGNDSLPDQPLDHPPHPEHDTWHPFSSHGHFKLADFIFRRNQMPAKQIDDLMQWQSLSLRHPDFEMLQNDPNAAPWKHILNPEFAGGIDYAPRQVFGEQGQRVWTDLMAGNWAWGQCNTIADDPDHHSAMFVPVVLGSDKTTVSIATGQNDYYLLYVSASNLHNNICHAHRESPNEVTMEAKSFEPFAIIYSKHHYGQFLNPFIMQ
ncbi:uncharacterized protein HD556DRAFT_1306412 [Suillus plorans]|uniref:Uncharacterized protein n=1 Tax=Suillus plorans TaxID=116603 RepID=A0A9P7J003_9AGAM|nr:uncharacterized protein HD556DRAFT_1306412 [Suillus plorans]KAG1797820.1 hypothetical protein HD556DRAFT_1306412 [Suillus plorans]